MTKENALLIQTYSFCILAILASIFSTHFLSSGIFILVLIVIVLGVPHGSIDTLFARELFNFSNLRAWCKFTALYSLIAISVVGLWILSAPVFLALFLIASIWHFSDDLMAGTPKLIRLIYGGAIIFLPAIFYANELNVLFGYLTDSNSSKKIVLFLSWVSIPWLILVGVSLIYIFKKSRVTFFELASLSILATLTHPLVGFSIYFCAMHSARHIIRSLNFLQKTTTLSIILAVILPTLAIFLMWAILFNSLSIEMVDANLIKLIFVTLAALTVPHMLMLERSGFRRWVYEKKSL